MARNTSSDFPVAGRLRLRLVDPLPTGIGIELLQGFCESGSVFAEILLKYASVRADDEGHDTGGAVFRGMCHERKTLGHLAVDDVALCAARGMCSLPLQDMKVIATIRSLNNLPPIVGISLGDRRCHQRPDGAL